MCESAAEGAALGTLSLMQGVRGVVHDGCQLGWHSPLTHLLYRIQRADWAGSPHQFIEPLPVPLSRPLLRTQQNISPSRKMSLTESCTQQRPQSPQHVETTLALPVQDICRWMIHSFSEISYPIFKKWDFGFSVAITIEKQVASGWESTDVSGG